MGRIKSKQVRFQLLLFICQIFYRVNYILNVTKEVDNFYPNQFIYQKIWVSDEATTELLMHWQRTYEFIKNAKNNNSVVLVHCKKGISRSSSTVIAYIMKEYGESLESALNYVKEKRNCITPNSGFMEQLTTFDGMLQASSNRHSHIFNTKVTTSESSSSKTGKKEISFRIMKFCKGTVRQHRDKFEKGSIRKTYPPSNVSIFKKFIFYTGFEKRL